MNVLKSSENTYKHRIGAWDCEESNTDKSIKQNSK